MMIDYDNVAEFLKNVPLIQISLSIGLFFLAIIVSRLTKRAFKKQAAKPLDEESFWSKFIHQEKKFITRCVSFIVWIAFLVGIFYVWEEQINELFVAAQVFYAPLARSAVILVVAVLVFKVAHLLTDFILERVTPFAEKASNRAQLRTETLRHVFHYGSTIIIIVLTSLTLIDTFGIDIKAVLASVGIASVAIGFGAQNLVKDIIGGIFILAEDQYGVGDVVMINGEGGFVEKMTLRITQLRNTEGMLITVPNGAIDMVKNLTTNWSRVDFKIGVAYETNLDHAMDVLMDEAKKLKTDMPKEIIEDPERLGVDEFGDSSITLRIWIKTQPLKQWMVKREFNRRIHIRFEKEGIEIPFPQHTLWVKEPKEEILARLAERVK